MQFYELRDPVHKRIKFSEAERQIIDHPFMQRLRFISQGGLMQSYVYPGSNHDRFMHCIGAMHVASRLVGRCISSSSYIKDKLTVEEIRELTRRVRAAGLLHDIGHAPFSHSLECLFPALKDLPLQKDWWSDLSDRQSVHEDFSVLLIQTMAEEGVFDAGFAQDVSSFIHDGVKPGPFLQSLEEKIPTLPKIIKTLISGVADCDRMDYLLRDSHYCGVSYGMFDIDWMISCMGMAELDGCLIRTVSENGVRAFEDMLLARYHMMDQVYYHKTKYGFVEYLKEAIEQKEIELAIPADPYLYADLRDSHVLDLLHEAAKEEGNYWSYHLMNRIPAKRVLRLLSENRSDMKQLAKLEKLCQKEEIRYFTQHHKIAVVKGSDSDDVMQNIFVTKKTLKGTDYVPIGEHSNLIQKYAEVMDYIDFYVLIEDKKKFDSLI
jgi:HD superfamily phosphohydrolase